MNKNKQPGKQLINGYEIATIDSIQGRFAYAVARGEFVKFEIATGHNVIAGNSQFPEFGSNYPVRLPGVGDSVVVFPESSNGGWIATLWGCYSEFKAAQKVIMDRLALPKAAPKTEPVVVAAANAEVRKLFVPRRLTRVNTSPAAKSVVKPVAVQLPITGPISFETALAGGYDLSGEGAIGVECTIAPAPKANVAAVTSK